MGTHLIIMKKILFIAALGIAGIVNAENFVSSENSLKFKFQAEAQYIFGTCTMTFTAYNSAGEALYSWTEYRQADSYEQCLDMGLKRLNELNNKR